MRTDGGYQCQICVDFTDIDTGADINKPVEGKLIVIIGENVPHPVELGIENIDGKGDAPYVQFENRTRTVETHQQYPINFHFNTEASREMGGKWYFYRTADWSSNLYHNEKENPEFVKHHTPGIPSAQQIRLMHKILENNGGDEILRSLLNLYDGEPQAAASKFSDEIKKYVGFESRAKVQNFLMERTPFHRSKSATVNKVAKQLVKEEYRHRADSLGDVKNMVSIINKQDNFPDITIKEVFNRTIERSGEEELDKIADQLQIDDWSVIFSDSN